MVGAVLTNLVPYVKPSNDRLVINRSINIEYNVLINAYISYQQ